MRYVRSGCSPVLLLALMFSICSNVAYAQSDTSQISGYATDATGGVVPGATVTATNEVTGLERQAETNEKGYYVAANLPPGNYTITAEAQGFKRYVKT